MELYCERCKTTVAPSFRLTRTGNSFSCDRVCPRCGEKVEGETMGDMWDSEVGDKMVVGRVVPVEVTAPPGAATVDKSKQEVVSAAGGMKERSGKDDWSLMQPLWRCLKPVVRVLMFGAKKYDRDNWIKVPAREYEAAAMRHWADYQCGEWAARDSGMPHLAHMLTDLLFAFWHRLEERGHD